MDNRVIEEIELSISFGQRYMQYEKEILDLKSKRWDDNRKYDQYLQQDRSIIVQIIAALEAGDTFGTIQFYKKMMTAIGAEFFKKEFKALKNLLAEPV